MRGRDEDRGAPVIRGVGLATPLGVSAWSTAAALLAGRTTADRLARCAESGDPLDATTLARATGGSAFAGLTLTDPAVELAERAAREALADAGAAGGDCVRTIVASSKGAVLSLLKPASTDRRKAAATLGPHGFLLAESRRRLSLGETTAVVAACATSIHAIEQAVREIRAGTPRVLVIAVESALHPLFVESYRRLGALAPIDPIGAHRCAPLDQSRRGFTLNECAAAIVLESPGAAATSGWGRIAGVATGVQPYDLVRAAPEFTTLERLVRRVAGDGAPLALVQPHATGTPDNDEREMRALERALGDGRRGAPAYAAKGAIGHALGAAGLVNIVLGCLFGRIGRLPPMPWLDRPIPTSLSLSRDGRPIERGLHVCVASGFGGHVGAVAVAPVD